MTASGSARTPVWVWALGILAVAYIVYLLIVSLAAAGNAQAAGYVVGFIVGAFVIALIVRFAYVRLRSGAVPFLSPWVIVVAAVVVMLMRLTTQAGT